MENNLDSLEIGGTFRLAALNAITLENERLETVNKELTQRVAEVEAQRAAEAAELGALRRLVRDLGPLRKVGVESWDGKAIGGHIIGIGTDLWDRFTGALALLGGKT